jgi:hypothetical protein
MVVDSELKWGKRSPKDYDEETRKEAMDQLHDESRALIEFIHVCVLLDIARNLGYAMARRGEIPGAIRVGDKWKVRRAELKKFLYGEE